MSQVPFQLLELSVISAQDLAPVSKNLRTYAIVWVNPERKLRTRIDQQGQNNPTWNDKFVFRVDDKFLSSDSSVVMVEIYAIGWLRDIHVGSVRVLTTNLIPPSIRKQSNSSRRFVALQIRRPSGRPQGILNMGVTLLDNTMKSMPLYTELSASAVGYQDLMDVKMYKHNLHNVENDNKFQEKQKKNPNQNPNQNIKLWRSRSDRTELNNRGFPKKVHKGSSLCNGSFENGSVINGSMLNASEVVVPPLPTRPPIGGNGSICSDVGPSASVVAAAVAKGLYPTPLGQPHKPGSSILGDWTMEDYSVEGLKSKIERWRMEVPRRVPDHSYQRIQRNRSHRHSRRHTEGGGRLFSCFGNAYGCEFTIVCGANGNNKKNLSRSGSGSQLQFSPSELDS